MDEIIGGTEPPLPGLEYRRPEPGHGPVTSPAPIDAGEVTVEATTKT